MNYHLLRFKQEFYKLGCEVSFQSGNDKTQLSLSGLQSNFEASLQLFEDILSNA